MSLAKELERKYREQQEERLGGEFRTITLRQRIKQRIIERGERRSKLRDMRTEAYEREKIRSQEKLRRRQEERAVQKGTELAKLHYGKTPGEKIMYVGGKLVGAAKTVDRKLNLQPIRTKRIRDIGFGGFDTGFDISRRPSGPRKKPKSKTKYKVIGGKAYPIGGTGGKKKKPRRKTRDYGFGSFDMFDNQGFL